jgi:arylsulfatase A-like enzyme
MKRMVERTVAIASSIAATLAIAVVVPWSGAALAAERPNILLIVADDMGYSDASPYGGEIFTPNIARLANQGMMFTNFHVAAYCAPTRAMLLTGADNHLVGLGNMIELAADNQLGKPGYEGFLNNRAVTLATMLKKVGYHTYLAGKWHLGKDPTSIPAAQGFEQSVGVLEGGADNWENKSYTPKYRAVHFFDGRKALDLPADFYSSKFYAERMISDIDANLKDGKPFFGYLAFQAVHQPHQAPAEFTERYVWTYRAGWSAIRNIRYQRQVELGLVPADLSVADPLGAPNWNALSPDEQRMDAKRMAVYAGMLEYMDMSIGRVMDALQKDRVLDNTIIVFMSDNGGEAAKLQDHFVDYYRNNFDLTYEHLGEKGSYSEYGPGWASASVTPLTNYKGSASEGGVRAPLIIRYPQAVPQGRRSNAFAYVLDIVPTVLDLAGVIPHDGRSAPLGGHSMAPLLAGESDHVHGDNDAVVYEAAGGAAVYRGDYKLVRNVPPYGNRAWHLYDLRTDPIEADDLAAEKPDAVKDLQAAYADYVRKNGVVEVPADYDIVKQAQANMARHGD